MTLLCKVIKWGWRGGWGTKMRERWFSKCLASSLCFSIWLSAPQLTCSLMLLMAGTLLQVQLPRPVTHHWAPPSLPATAFWVATSQSQKNHTWKLSSASPFPGLTPLHVLLSAMILALLCFLTSPSGNGSCLAIIILFCWSALISSLQLVSDPEAKRAQKGKHYAESLSGLLACLTSAFVVWLDVSKIVLKRIAGIVAAFPHPAARAAQGICILIAVSFEGAAVPSFSWQWCPRLGGLSDRPIWNETVTLPPTASLGKKHG